MIKLLFLFVVFIVSMHAGEVQVYQCGEGFAVSLEKTNNYVPPKLKPKDGKVKNKKRNFLLYDDRDDDDRIGNKEKINIIFDSQPGVLPELKQLVYYTDDELQTRPILIRGFDIKGINVSQAKQNKIKFLQNLNKLFSIIKENYIEYPIFSGQKEDLDITEILKSLVENDISIQLPKNDFQDKDLLITILKTQIACKKIDIDTHFFEWWCKIYLQHIEIETLIEMINYSGENKSLNGFDFNRTGPCRLGRCILWFFGGAKSVINMLNLSFRLMGSENRRPQRILKLIWSMSHSNTIRLRIGLPFIMSCALIGWYFFSNMKIPYFFHNQSL
jgi:hypothetical protein